MKKMSTTSKVSAPQAEAAQITQTLVLEERSLWQDAVRQFVKNRLAVGGFIIIMLFIFAALLGPYVAPYDFLDQELDNALQPPSATHWLGTDELGRDIFSRILHGARTAALVSLSSTIVSLLIGLAVGTTAGFAGGRIDQFLMWVSDLVQSIPGLLLAMLVNTALKRPIVDWFDALYETTRNPVFLNTLWLDFVLVFGALALIGWPGLARLIRGQVLSISQTDYVLAARGVGSGRVRIMIRHIVPNALGPLVVSVSQGMGGAILAESGLSFLGVGVQPPNASWGSMLNRGLSMWQIFPHLMVAPAVAIGLVQVAFIFFGDGLNDALNPRYRRL
jgi:ABC-type dipeptide/oligopeptide/nickel transport system permease subunit